MSCLGEFEENAILLSVDILKLSLFKTYDTKLTLKLPKSTIISLKNSLTQVTMEEDTFENICDHSRLLKETDA